MTDQLESPEEMHAKINELQGNVSQLKETIKELKENHAKDKNDILNEICKLSRLLLDKK